MYALHTRCTHFKPLFTAYSDPLDFSVARILPKNAHFAKNPPCGSMIPQGMFCIIKDKLKDIGILGRRHYDYLKTNKPTVINVMRMNSTLNDYLKSVNEQAEEMLFQLVKQMAKAEGVTEQLKATDQLEWGAGLRYRPLPKAEAPTEAAAETAV